jgi:hypothetical protein
MEKYIKKITKNLKKENLSFEEFKNNFRCAGGFHPESDKKDSKLKREWEQAFKGKERPNHKDRCLCNHHIKRNYYIKHIDDDEKILILGCCCIKRFLNKKGRRCDMCDELHKNRKTNRCNKCKDKRVCSICNEKYELCILNDNEKKCYDCIVKENKSDSDSDDDLKENWEHDYRYYLNVPFKEKDEAKKLGAFWDHEKKKWYAPRPRFQQLLISKYK